METADRTALLTRHAQVLEKIRISADRAGRLPEDVCLLAVSKTKAEEDILALYEAGQRDFGENYVQELCGKYEHLPKDIRWHMIGHLQRNKVKYIAPFVHLIHSVDSLSLVETIEKEAVKNERILSILVEVNVGEEESKFGIKTEALPAFLMGCAAYPHVRVRGLMTSAPPVGNAEENRRFFAELRDLSVDIIPKTDNNNERILLSMGMSNDYPVAVEEGATHVRVGTEIFGARTYA